MRAYKAALGGGLAHRGVAGVWRVRSVESGAGMCALPHTVPATLSSSQQPKEATPARPHHHQHQQSLTRVCFAHLYCCNTLISVHM